MADLMAQMDINNRLIRWIIDAAQPPAGWRSAEATFKPTNQGIWMNLVIDDGQQKNSMGGCLQPGSPAIADVVALQQACFDRGTGTWVTATIRATHDPATGKIGGGGSYNYDQDPGSVVGEGPFTPEQARAFLKRFPRKKEHIPDWLAALAKS